MQKLVLKPLIFQFKRIPHNASRPVQATRTMKVDRLPVILIPHDSRILQEFSAMKTAVSRSREAKRIRGEFRYPSSDRHDVLNTAHPVRSSGGAPFRAFRLLETGLSECGFPPVRFHLRGHAKS